MGQARLERGIALKIDSRKWAILLTADMEISSAVPVVGLPLTGLSLYFLNKTREPTPPVSAYWSDCRIRNLPTMLTLGGIGGSPHQAYQIPNLAWFRLSGPPQCERLLWIGSGRLLLAIKEEPLQ